jgi:transcriptional regulator with XRE-family HTH domain
MGSSTISTRLLEGGRELIITSPEYDELIASLRAERDKRCLTNEELARLVGVSPTALSGIINGSRGASSSLLIRVARALELSTSAVRDACHTRNIALKEDLLRRTREGFGCR